MAVSLDSLYTAWVKAHYPLEFYEVVLEMFSNDKDTRKVALIKNEAYRYKGIKVVPLKFGQDNTKFTSDKIKNEIYQSLMSVKGINENVAIVLNQLKNNKYNNFYDLYLDMKSHGLSKTHISNLIKIGYFNDITNKRTALWLADHYGATSKKIFNIDKKTLKKDNIDEIYKNINPNITLIEFYNELKNICKSDTPKQFSFDEGVLPRYLYSLVELQDNDKLEELTWEMQLLGTTIDDIDEKFLLGTVVKYNPSTNRIIFKHCKTGIEFSIKNNSREHIKEKNIIFIESISTKKIRGREYLTAEKIINLSEKYLDKKN